MNDMSHVITDRVAAYLARQSWDNVDELAAIVKELFEIEARHDETSPCCDICGEYEDETPHMGWDGDTGLHVACETNEHPYRNIKSEANDAVGVPPRDVPLHTPTPMSEVFGVTHEYPTVDVPVTLLDGTMTLVGECGGLSSILDAAPSNAMPGMIRVETEHGPLYLDPDENATVLEIL